MAESAISRASRALDLVPYILAHEGISLEELAEEFDTSVLGVTSDLDLLFVCGLPGYTPLELIDLSYEDGVVTIIDPQVLNAPRKFTRAEVTSLVLALELLRSTYSGNPETSQIITGLISKLSALISGSPPTTLAIPPQYSKEETDNLALVQRAITDGAAVGFSYLSPHRDAIEARRVIPQTLSALGAHLYLQGFCLDRQQDRTFRFDRISQVVKLSLTNLERLPMTTAPKVTVTLLVSFEAMNFIEDNSAIVSSREKQGDFWRVELEVSDEQWVLREVMKFGGAVQILAPANLADALKIKAERALSRYA